VVSGNTSSQPTATQAAPCAASRKAGLRKRRSTESRKPVDHGVINSIADTARPASQFQSWSQLRPSK
jgi:hypothetical protein